MMMASGNLNGADPKKCNSNNQDDEECLEIHIREGY